MVMISRAIHVDSCNKSALSKLQITPTKLELSGTTENLWYHNFQISRLGCCVLLSIKHLTTLKSAWYPKLIFIYFDNGRINDHGKNTWIFEDRKFLNFHLLIWKFGDYSCNHSFWWGSFSWYSINILTCTTEHLLVRGKSIMGLFDLFRPKWKHSDSNKRLEAINEVTDQNVLC